MNHLRQKAKWGMIMCEFCDYYHSSKGGISGKTIKINKCANKNGLTDYMVIDTRLALAMGSVKD